MKLLKFIQLFILFAYFPLQAQQIYFCKSHTSDGQPIDAGFTFNIDSWGGSLYIMLNNEGKEIGDDLLYLFIDKNDEGAFEPFDSHVLHISSHDTWTAIDYNFREPGLYLVYFLNSVQERLAEEKISIKSKNAQSQQQVYSSSYYDNCQIQFCERVISGKPLNVKKSTSLSQNDGEIYIYVRHNKPLKTDKFLVDVWKKKNRAFDYDEFVGSKKYKLEPSWNDAFFKFKFSESGEYKFTIYNSEEIIIGSTYITVR